MRVLNFNPTKTEIIHSIDRFSTDKQEENINY